MLSTFLSNDGKIVVCKGVFADDVVNVFADEMAAALRRLGRDVTAIDLALTEAVPERLQEALAVTILNPKAALSTTLHRPASSPSLSTIPSTTWSV